MSSFDRPRHPGRTAAQRKALDAIGSDQLPKCLHTMKALPTAGLIVEAGSRTRRDVLGAYRPPVYEMPIPVHFQWCSTVAFTDVEMAGLKAVLSRASDT